MYNNKTKLACLHTSFVEDGSSVPPSVISFSIYLLKLNAGPVIAINLRKPYMTSSLLSREK